MGSPATNSVAHSVLRTHADHDDPYASPLLLFCRHHPGARTVPGARTAAATAAELPAGQLVLRRRAGAGFDRRADGTDRTAEPPAAPAARADAGAGRAATGRRLPAASARRRRAAAARAA